MDKDDRGGHPVTSTREIIRPFNREVRDHQDDLGYPVKNSRVLPTRYGKDRVYSYCGLMFIV